jgi:hypothetical protein
MHSDRYEYHFLSAGILLSLLLAGVAAFKPIGDFGNFYFGSYFMAKGMWGDWMYTPYLFNMAIYKEGMRNFFLNYAAVPPLTSIVYLPFTLVEPETAKLIWNICSVAVLFAAIRQWVQYLKLPAWVYLVFPVVFCISLRNNFYEGQTYCIIFFLLTAGFFFSEQKKYLLMSLCWALAIHLKISPAFVAFYLLSRKDVKGLFYLSSAILVMALTSAPFISVVVWKQFVFDILPRLSAGEINNPYVLNYQSFQVMMKQLLVSDALYNPGALFNQPVLFKQVTLYFQLLVLVGTLLCCQRGISAVKQFSLWVTASFLLSGYGMSYCLILIGIVWLAEISQHDLRKSIVYSLLAGLISTLPYNVLATAPVVLRFHRFYLLLMLLLYQCKALFSRTALFAFAGCALVFLIPFRVVDARGTYVPVHRDAIMIGQLQLHEHMLVYRYFSFYGPKQDTIHLPFELKQTRWIVQDKSVCINDSVCYFLSDERIGVGFNTLKKEVITPTP